MCETIKSQRALNRKNFKLAKVLVTANDIITNICMCQDTARKICSPC